MMSWEAIPKRSGGRHRFPFPTLLVVFTHGKAHSQESRFLGDALAFDILPPSVVFLRDGGRLALRNVESGDPLSVVRAVTRFPKTRQVAISTSGAAEVGDRFRIVPNGDLFLLEPLAKRA